jgi:hypothetical protein
MPSSLCWPTRRARKHASWTLSEARAPTVAPCMESQPPTRTCTTRKASALPQAPRSWPTSCQNATPPSSASWKQLAGCCSERSASTSSPWRHQRQSALQSGAQSVGSRSDSRWVERRFGGRAGDRPRRPSCSRELPDLDRHLRDASRVAPVETEPAPSESYPAGCVAVERTRDTWLPRLQSNLSAAAAKQRARRRSRMRVAVTRRRFGHVAGDAGWANAAASAQRADHGSVGAARIASICPTARAMPSSWPMAMICSMSAIEAKR